MATNFAQEGIGKANEIKSMGKEISRKELRQRIIKGILTSHAPHGGLILTLNQGKRISIATLQQLLSEYDHNVTLS